MPKNSFVKTKSTKAAKSKRKSVAKTTAASSNRKRASAKTDQNAKSFLENSEYLRLLVDSFPVCISYIDSSRRYQFNNKTYEQWFGHRLEEIRGKHMKDVLGAPVFKIIKKHVDAALSGKNVTFDLMAPFQDGPERYIHVHYVPHFAASGKVKGFYVLAEDLSDRKRMEDELAQHRNHLEKLVEKRTSDLSQINKQLKNEVAEHKKAEEALRAGEEKFRQLFSAEPDAILMMEAESRRIIDVNPSAEKLYGYSRKEFLNLTGLDISAEPEKTIKAMVETNLGKVTQIPLRYHKRKDGTIFPVEMTTGAFSLKNKRVVFGVIRDITERKRAEEEYRFLADHQPALIWGAGPDKRCNYFNKVWLDYTGRTLEQELGNGWAEGIHPDDFQKCLIIYHTAFDARQPFEMEYRLRRADGSFGWIYDKGVPRYDSNGEFAGYLGTCLEISQIKQTEEKLKFYSEELERSNRELEDFAAIASHDLQEPLRKIVIFGDRLKATAAKLEDRERDYLERMQKAANRMQQFINDLLQYSQLSTRTKPFELTCLEHIVNEVILDLEVRMVDTGGKVEIKNLPSLEADKLQMRQLFQNLLSNALKFHRKGVAPVIIIDSRLTDNDFWEITVEDNGIGFDVQYMQQIFKPFERLHGRSAYEGTGMGLAICQKIITRHGGEITAKSVLQKGTTFIITLPKKQSE